jgi:hypothetical protein
MTTAAARTLSPRRRNSGSDSDREGGTPLLVVRAAQLSAAYSDESSSSDGSADYDAGYASRSNAAAAAQGPPNWTQPVSLHDRIASARTTIGERLAQVRQRYNETPPLYRFALFILLVVVVCTVFLLLGYLWYQQHRGDLIAPPTKTPQPTPVPTSPWASAVV